MTNFKKTISVFLVFAMAFSFSTVVLAESNFVSDYDESIIEQDLLESWASFSAAQEQSLEVAKDLAYMDINLASADLREAILEARNQVIFSVPWAADGVSAYIVYEDGTKEALPQFSDVFPNWEIPLVYCVN